MDYACYTHFVVVPMWKTVQTPIHCHLELFLRAQCRTCMYVTNFFVWYFRAEYSAFWKCVQAGAAYLVTQLVKMMALETFFPASDTPPGGFDVMGVCHHLLLVPQ